MARTKQTSKKEINQKKPFKYVPKQHKIPMFEGKKGFKGLKAPT